MNTDVVTVKTNHWLVPSVKNAFSGWLEGAPTQEEKLQVIAKAVADRAAWAPSVEALELVETLKTFVGSRVQIEFWHDSMWMFPEEAPYPLLCDCRGVVTLMDDGFPQAYIEVCDLVEVPTEDGFSPMVYLQNREGSEYALAPLSDLYQISKIKG